MPIKHSARSLPVARRLITALFYLACCALALVGCTRDDVAAAVSTLAVELEATLQPWGATVAANAQAIESRVPSALATAKAVPATATVPVLSEVTPSPTLTSMPSATATPPATATPQPTASHTPAPTKTATPTPMPTNTPYPEQLDVPGGFMVLVPGGYFQMGAAAESLVEECNLFREGCSPEWFVASEPIHEVLLGRYYIDAHEVTNAAYAVFLNEGASENLCSDLDCLDEAQSELRLQDGRYTMMDGTGSNPMAGVTWHGAAAYCEWRGGRLPTEAEWEKAAAWDWSGAIARRYPWGDTFDGGKVNFCDASCMEPQAHADFNDGFPSVAPVMSFEAGRSAYGAYDMAGNLWEWVADWYDPNYYAQSSGANPPGAASGEAKVVRGGSWFDTGNFTASTIRFPSSPENADRTIGFRCATDIP